MEGDDSIKVTYVTLKNPITKDNYVDFCASEPVLPKKCPVRMEGRGKCANTLDCTLENCWMIKD